MLVATVLYHVLRHMYHEFSDHSLIVRKIQQTKMTKNM